MSYISSAPGNQKSVRLWVSAVPPVRSCSLVCVLLVIVFTVGFIFYILCCFLYLYSIVVFVYALLIKVQHFSSHKVETAALLPTGRV